MALYVAYDWDLSRFLSSKHQIWCLQTRSKPHPLVVWNPIKIKFSGMHQRLNNQIGFQVVFIHLRQNIHLLSYYKLNIIWILKGLFLSFTSLVYPTTWHSHVLNTEWVNKSEVLETVHAWMKNASVIYLLRIQNNSKISWSTSAELNVQVSIIFFYTDIYSRFRMRKSLGQHLSHY